MNNLLILGAGGHGKVIAESAEAMRKWDKISFLDDGYETGFECNGYPVLGGLDSCSEFLDNYKDLFVAISNNISRIEYMKKFSEAGFNFPNIIHPTAIISNSVKINNGIAVMANSVINCSAVIGNAVIINTSASVDHDCILDDGVHISPGVNLAGYVKVGRLTWIGIGSSVIERTKIGEAVIVGAGSVVINDIPDKKTVVGNPAKSIK